MSDDDRNQGHVPINDPDPNDGTRIASIAPASIPPASVSVEGGETSRNVVIGALLNHTYRVEALLARGGMGEVYRATHVELGTEHAIKVILPELTDNTRVVDMFRREAASLRNVRDDAVVAYDGVFRDEHGRLYLVMEFVSGPSLSERLRQGALDPEEVLRLRDRIAGGLAAAHEKGIIHRDMSPDNVILPGGRLEHAKILDFGIAKLTDPEAKTIIGDDFAGKYSYVSPEQLGMFGGGVDARSDIYSVGLVLAAAARGRPLDMGMSPLAVVEARRTVPDLSDIPEVVRGPLEHMLQPDPKDRPQTMAEIIGVRGSGAASGPARTAASPPRASVPREPVAAAQRARPPQGTEKPARQGRSIVGLALGVGVATMLAGGVGYYFLMFEPSREAVQASRTEPPRLTPAAPQLTPVTPPTPAAQLTPAPQLAPAAPEPPIAPPSISPSPTAAAPEPPPAPPSPGPAALSAETTPLSPAPLASPPTTATPSIAAPAPTRVTPPPAPPAPPPPQAATSAQPAEGAQSGQQTALVAPPAVQPTVQAPPTPAVAAPPSAAEMRRMVDRVIRNFSCARLVANPANGAWTISGFVATPQDLRRLHNDLASAGVPSPRVEAEVYQRPLCEVAEMLHANTAVRREDAALRIGLNSPNRSYRDGDQLVVDVTSQIPAERFLYVSYVDKEGNVLHLLPKPGTTDNKAAAGRTFRFGQNKEYMISPPYGTDMIIAVASPVRLFDSMRPEEETGATYFADLQASLRKHNPSGSTGSVVSNYVLITTSP